MRNQINACTGTGSAQLDQMHPLSPCEFEIAELSALNLTKKEIAVKTFRSIGTVETTTKNIYRKLRISKATELTLWYCGYMFGIAQQIADKKTKILTAALALFICFDISIQANTMQSRIRRCGRRRQDTEIIFYKTSICA